MTVRELVNVLLEQEPSLEVKYLMEKNGGDVTLKTVESAYTLMLPIKGEDVMHLVLD